MKALELALDVPASFAAAGGCIAPAQIAPSVATETERAEGAGGVCCIVADPPWRIDLNRKTPHERTERNGDGWGVKHVAQLEYPTMSDDEIAALRPPAAECAHLYIWTVNAKVEVTYRIAREWGFRPSSLLTWIKSPMGIGLGGTFCNTTEFVLFCRRGTLRAKRRIETTWFGWPRGKHSAKPEEFQSIVESVSPGPYLEMFARRKRHGWLHWGNEVENDVRLESVSSGGGGGVLVGSETPTTEKQYNKHICD